MKITTMAMNKVNLKHYNRKSGLIILYLQIGQKEDLLIQHQL